MMRTNFYEETLDTNGDGRNKKISFFFLLNRRAIVNNRLWLETSYEFEKIITEIRKISIEDRADISPLKSDNPTQAYLTFNIALGKIFRDFLNNNAIANMRIGVKNLL